MRWDAAHIMNWQKTCLSNFLRLLVGLFSPCTLTDQEHPFSIKKPSKYNIFGIVLVPHKYVVILSLCTCSHFAYRPMQSRLVFTLRAIEKCNIVFWHHILFYFIFIFCLSFFALFLVWNINLYEKHIPVFIRLMFVSSQFFSW